MTATVELTPMERAARSAFEKALERGAPAMVRWSVAGSCWIVPSSRAGEGPWEVTRRRPFVEKPYDPDRTSRRPGQWWWSYDCNCPAAVQSGYKICWHRAAVWAWCLCYHVFDPVVQRDKYQRELKRHVSRLQRWTEAVADGKAAALYLPILTANVPDPLTGELWVDAEELTALGGDDQAGEEHPDDERAYGPVYYDVSDDGTVYRVDPEAPDNSLDAPAGRFYDGVGDDDTDDPRGRSDRESWNRKAGLETDA